MENMTYMTSTASNAGVGDITVYVKQGTDPDRAAVNGQNRVSKATGPVSYTHLDVYKRQCRKSCRLLHPAYLRCGGVVLRNEVPLL